MRLVIKGACGPTPPHQPRTHHPPPTPHTSRSPARVPAGGSAAWAAPPQPAAARAPRPRAPALLLLLLQQQHHQLLLPLPLLPPPAPPPPLWPLACGAARAAGSARWSASHRHTDPRHLHINPPPHTCTRTRTLPPPPPTSQKAPPPHPMAQRLHGERPGGRQRQERPHDIAGNAHPASGGGACGRRACVMLGWGEACGIGGGPGHTDALAPAHATPPAPHAPNAVARIDPPCQWGKRSP